MRHPLIFGILMLLLVVPAHAERVTVFAAASLKEALDQIAEDFAASSGHEIVASYAGSGVLARQIMDGAPADLFISANEAWMDAVADAGLLAPGSRRDLVENDLVLIAHDGGADVTIDGDLDLVGMLDGGRLAVAMVDAVPAGQYGKAALQNLGLWDQVALHLAEVDHVRAALRLVARGEAPLGITYASDVRAAPEVRIIGWFPADSHPPIIYPAARLTDAPAGRAFLDWLTGPEAAVIFAEAGFRIPD